MENYTACIANINKEVKIRKKQDSEYEWKCSKKGSESQEQPGMGHLIEDLPLLFFKLGFVFPIQSFLFDSSILVFGLAIYRRQRKKWVNVENKEEGYKIDIWVSDSPFGCLTDMAKLIYPTWTPIYPHYCPHKFAPPFGDGNSNLPVPLD